MDQSKVFYASVKQRIPNAFSLSLTLLKIGLFGADHGLGGGVHKGPPSLKSVTHTLQWWNLAQLYLS